jgi:hypothetical protein
MACDNRVGCAGRNAADLKTGLYLLSAWRKMEEFIPRTRNNFKGRKTIPTQYA